MSTVPKLTYARIGKSSKTKAETVSSELTRSKQEKQGDLFSHMNQENLNYIKKELKLKKNRSDRERSRSPQRDPVDSALLYQDEERQRLKIYQKYRGQQQVSEKEDHLEDTQRRSDEARPLNLFLPEDTEQEYNPSEYETVRFEHRERNVLSSTHHGAVNARHFEQNQPIDPKMYQSLPYEEAKKKMVSIEGFEEEAISANLNKNEGGQFIQFLQDYICDLNHSKALKSPEKGPQQVVSTHKRQTKSIHKKPNSQEPSVSKIKHQVDSEFKADIRKLQMINRNSDTLGEPNSKYSIQSHHSISSARDDRLYLQQKLKQEKYNTLILAQEIHKLRQMLVVKDNIIKKVETQNQLLREDMRHLKNRQDIQSKSRKYSSHNDYIDQLNVFSRHNRGGNEQNEIKYSDFKQPSNSHQRHASTNPNKTTYSYRSSMRPSEDHGELFQHFAQPLPQKKEYETSREKRHAKKNDSLDKLEREYANFELEDKETFRKVARPKRSRGVL